MSEMMPEPKSLQEAIVYFANPDNCIDYLAIRRWPEGRVVCPSCGSDKVKFNPNRRLWQCSSHHSKRQFSIKVGTIMEDSAIGLDKWLTAMWLITNCKNGVSSYEIARDVKVTQKSAWFMLHRIRLAMQDEFFGSKLRGEVEADETFIGGKARNMHKNVKARRITGQGRNTDDKIMVMGMLERGGKIRTQIISDRKQETMHSMVKSNVEAGASLYTDEFGAYKGLHSEYEHQIVDHALRYVDGRVHTNGLENFWSLLKRGLGGTYVAVEPFHLFRYLDEQVFRCNNRGSKQNRISDSDRLDMAVSSIFGKRLTFAQLTGKEGGTIN
ncbi:MAG: IS1595 family transposase [Acidobacteriia bacterium]|nr:IS1595 family transposase [Terriglobia bacterium]